MCELLGMSANVPTDICFSFSGLVKRGGVNLENTHPFIRELWGRNWTYAHNGQLTGYEDLAMGYANPVGQTDSERAFCWILNKLHQEFKQQPDDMLTMFKYVAGCADQLKALGVFNMLLTDGEYVMCYCTNNLHWITRRAPFGKAQLIDEDMTVDFQQETSATDVVTVIATRPLTKDEAWNKMNEGEFCVFRFGERVL